MIAADDDTEKSMMDIRAERAELAAFLTTLTPQHGKHPDPAGFSGGRI